MRKAEIRPQIAIPELAGRGYYPAQTERNLPTMNGIDSSTLLWLFVAAQVLGVSTAWLARLSEGKPHQVVSQWMFLGVLPLVGMATMVALAVGPGYWLASSVTLAFMVLTVTCDFRGSRAAATW